MSNFPRWVRQRIGVAQFADGWNVVVEFDGVRNVYDPTYATEAEADAQAIALRDALRANPDWQIREH